MNAIESYRNAKYDKIFLKAEQFEGTPSLYCSELIYISDYEKRIKCYTNDILGIGHDYISPQGLFNASNVIQKGLYD